VAFGEDGKVMATATEEGVVRLWDLAHGKSSVVFCERQSKYNLRGTPHIASIAMDARSRFLAVGIYGSLIIFNGHGEMKERAAVQGYETEIKSLCFAPDGKTLAGIGSTVRLWDPVAGKQIAQLPVRTPGTSYSSVAFSPDNKMLAIGLSGAAEHPSFVKISHLDANRELAHFKCHSDLISQLAWSPRGNIIVTASHDGTVKLWDVSDAIKGPK
jgi:WD40 repeat protein